MNGIRVSLFVLILSISHAESIQSVRGNLESEHPLATGGLVVELEKMGHPAPKMESSISGDGSFEFRDVYPGMYYLRLTSSVGITICEQQVQVEHERPLTLRVPDRPSKSNGETVSARRLVQPVPKKAFRAFADAERSALMGHTADAARSLERAVEIFPDYYEARCNLGIQYMRLGRRAEAIEQLETAAVTGPPSPIVLGNLSYVYFVVGRVAEAEKAARTALSLDSTSTLAHFILGSALARSVTPDSLEKALEATEHLRRGADASPAAHLGIAKIYQAENNPNGAKEELRLYLKSGDSLYRAQAERWLSGFR